MTRRSDLLKKRNIQLFANYIEGEPLLKMQQRYKLSIAMILLIVKNFKIIIGHADETRHFFKIHEKKHGQWIRKIEKLIMKDAS